MPWTCMRSSPVVVSMLKSISGMPASSVADRDLDGLAFQPANGRAVHPAPDLLDDLLAIGCAQPHQEVAAQQRAAVELGDDRHIAVWRANEAQVVGGAADVLPAHNDVGGFGAPVALVAVQRQLTAFLHDGEADVG